MNESFARKLFPKESPIDKHIGDCQGDDYPLGGLEPGYMVIGICGDAKYQNLRSKIERTMYEPMNEPMNGDAHMPCSPRH